MRTLIVDDSNFIREFTKQCMLRLGAECTEAVHGGLALDVLRADDAFDIMLVDWNMPVMNGLECVKRLREEGLGRDMKVMMVTTEADHSFISDAFAVGADEFLMKPFTLQSLREKLMLLGIECGAS